MSDMSDFDKAVVAAMLKAKEIGVKMLASDCEEILQAAKQSMQGEDKFSASDDADRLRSVARGMSYNDMSEATWKHVILEIAMRLDTGGYNTNAPDLAAKHNIEPESAKAFLQEWLDMQEPIAGRIAKAAISKIGGGE